MRNRGHGLTRLASLLAVGMVGWGAVACEGYDSGPSLPPPFRRITDVVLIQQGVPETLKTTTYAIGYPHVDAEHPFDLVWVTDGEPGVMSLQVAASGLGTVLEFQVPSGCGARFGARVSGLAPGWSWLLALRYDAIPNRPASQQNPCPNVVTYRNDYSGYWYADLTALPRTDPEPGSVTITRLANP